MKTIFISSFHQLISRNILSTPLLDYLSRSNDIRIVLFVQEDKRDFFQREFGADHILIEGVPWALSRREIFLRYLALSAVHTDALEIIRSVESNRLSSRLVRFFGGGRIGQLLLRRVDAFFTPSGRFAPFFEKYHPSLVFSTDIQNENDVRLIHEARRRGVAAIGAVRSWDNLTTKGMMRVVPDKLIVPNLIVRQEAMMIDYVPERSIVPVGIPHYDRYVKSKIPNSQLLLTREEFFQRMNLDPQKRTVLFAPIGNRYIKNNLLDRLVLETLGSFDINIIVRVPPSDYVSFDQGAAKKANMEFDIVGRGSPRGEQDRKRNEMGKEDDDSLINELFHCDAVVTGHSTITIDAAVFDKPVVLIAFDEVLRPFDDSVRRYYQCDYYRPITESGGVRFARTADELRLLVSQYLANPRFDEEGRKRIAREQAYQLDGRATERLAEVLLEKLGK